MRKIHGFVNVSSQSRNINFLSRILVLLSAARGCTVIRVRRGRLRSGSKAFEDGFEHIVPRDGIAFLDLATRGEERWGETLWQEVSEKVRSEGS